MRAGTLRARVEIQQPVKTRTASGAEAISYQRLCSRYCSIMVASAKEAENGGMQVEATEVLTLRLRYETLLSGIDPTWRLVFNGDALQVLSVENVAMRGKELRIRARRDAD